MATADEIDALLPQTQCTRCGYVDCRAYAQAVAAGEAGINQCPPGGAEGIERLAAATGRAVIALGAEYGSEGPRRVAVVDEDWCIGCTLCIAACPVDAIVGANKRMHTVIAEACTGCELCLPACPVDCIDMLAPTAGTGWAAWSPQQASEARARYAWRQQRLQRAEREQAERLIAKAEQKLQDLAAHSRITDAGELDRKRALIEAALARARARR